MRSSPDIRMVVGRFLRTKTDIFLLGRRSEYCRYSLSFVAQNSTPTLGVTVSELPWQTF